MIVKQYIKDFENLGFGMFVHFGVYSLIGRGEWIKHLIHIPDGEYEVYVDNFAPKTGWAKELADTAKNAGCRYITLTARHHDGFSLYDTKGLTDYDAPHHCGGRDLIREFVDACREDGLVPFFYHTLLDWHVPEYNTDFKAYLEYLRRSVEILCTEYGKIGGIWFDGKWNKPHDDWEEDALYSMIRKYQPEAMIINNTGLGARGELGHPELDSVTFERGKPQPINLDDSPKYIASEMCQIFADHWGYAEEDLNYKSAASIIEDLAVCRRCGSNFLLNVGPMPDGSLRLADRAFLDIIGKWVSRYGEAIKTPRPYPVAVEGYEKDFVLFSEANNAYYLFVHDLPIVGDPNAVIARRTDWARRFAFPITPKKIFWMENGEKLDFSLENGILQINATPFPAGVNYVVRVAKIEI